MNENSHETRNGANKHSSGDESEEIEEEEEEEEEESRSSSSSNSEKVKKSKSKPDVDEDEDEEGEGEGEEEEEEAAVVEEEKAPAIPRDDLKEELLHADINYGCILSFYEKFAKFASLKEYPIKLFESHLLERDVLPKKWCDLHLILMKHLTMGKHAKKEKWLAYLERVSLKTSLYFNPNIYVLIFVCFI